MLTFLVVNQMSYPATAKPSQKAMRNSPQQERAKATVERLVSAAESLLANDGWPGFTTNALAKNVGCPVATVYRYFPDKENLARVIAERAINEWNEKLTGLEEAFEADNNFFKHWFEYSESFQDLLASSRLTVAARRAMLAVPNLRALDQADTRKIAARLSSIIETQLEITSIRSVAIASTLIETTLALIDHVADSNVSDEEAKQLRFELKLMHESYLTALGLGPK